MTVKSNPPSLKEVQRQLKGLIASTGRSSKKVPAYIPKEVHGRLTAYQGGYVTRLVEAFEETFGVVRSLLGAERFWKAVEDFVRAHPSHSYNIGDAGEGFPSFLKAHFRSK